MSRPHAIAVPPEPRAPRSIPPSMAPAGATTPRPISTRPAEPPEAFVARLAGLARQHAAVDHPHLRRMAAGTLPDPVGALRDFAHQYAFYSGGFTGYLVGLIGQADDPRHRRVLQENLAEEHGQPPTGLDPDLAAEARRPHGELFADFKRAVGVDPGFALRHPPCAAVLTLRGAVTEACTVRGLAAGLGALGFATELIVPTVYGHLLDAIRRAPGVPARAGSFFEIHTHCDDGHADALLGIATELAVDLEARRAMWATTHRVLSLRAALWDELARRADEAARWTAEAG